MCIRDRAKQSGLYNKIVLKDKQGAKDFDENALQGLLGQMCIRDRSRAIKNMTTTGIL